MSANIDKQQKFIELRAEGHSFDEIAKRVQISKPTLIKWSKEFKEQIAEVSKVIEEQFIIEQKVKRTIRAQKLSDELDKAYEALNHTDYKKMTKKDLIGVIEKLENKLNAITGIDNIVGEENTMELFIREMGTENEGNKSLLNNYNRAKQEVKKNREITVKDN